MFIDLLQFHKHGTVLINHDGELVGLDLNLPISDSATRFVAEAVGEAINTVDGIEQDDGERLYKGIADTLNRIVVENALRNSIIPDEYVDQTHLKRLPLGDLRLPSRKTAR